MKKNVFYQVMMMALVAVFTISFTACGGDDTTDGAYTPPVVPGGPATGSGTEWVDLYMNWNVPMNQLKADVTGQGWTITSEINTTQTYASDSHPNIVLTYGSDFNGYFRTAQAVYNNSSEDFYNKCIEKVKTAYSATTVKTGNTMTGLAENLNGWDVSIKVIYTPETKMTMVQFTATGINTGKPNEIVYGIRTVEVEYSGDTTNDKLSISAACGTGSVETDVRPSELNYTGVAEPISWTPMLEIREWKNFRVESKEKVRDLFVQFGLAYTGWAGDNTSVTIHCKGYLDGQLVGEATRTIRPSDITGENKYMFETQYNKIVRDDE